MYLSETDDVWFPNLAKQNAILMFCYNQIPEQRAVTAQGIKNVNTIERTGSLLQDAL